MRRRCKATRALSPRVFFTLVFTCISLRTVPTEPTYRQRTRARYSPRRSTPARRLAFWPRLACSHPAKRELAIPLLPQRGRGRRHGQQGACRRGIWMGPVYARGGALVSAVEHASEVRKVWRRGISTRSHPQGAGSARTRHSCLNERGYARRSTAAQQPIALISLKKAAIPKLTAMPTSVRSRNLKPWRSTHRVPAPPPLRHLSYVQRSDLGEREPCLTQPALPLSCRPARLRPTTTPTRTRTLESTRRCSRTRSGH